MDATSCNCSWVRSGPLCGDACCTSRRSFREDPLDHLGGDILHRILALSNSWTLAQCACISTEWRKVAGDDLLWQPLCQALWKDKVGILPVAKHLPAMQAYNLSQLDGTRDVLTAQDLCGNLWEVSLTTAFFNHFGGNTNQLYQSMPPMRRYFNYDGSVQAGSQDPIYNGGSFTWRFVSQTRCGKPENLVAIKDFPKMKVSRREDWGWIMQSEWIVYKSLGLRDMDADHTSSFVRKQVEGTWLSILEGDAPPTDKGLVQTVPLLYNS